MDTQYGLLLIIISYIINTVFITLLWLENKNYVTLAFLNTARIVTAPKPVSSMFRVILPKEL